MEEVEKRRENDRGEESQDVYRLFGTADKILTREDIFYFITYRTYLIYTQHKSYIVRFKSLKGDQVHQLINLK